MTASGLLLAALLAAGAPIPATVSTEGETAVVLLQADALIGRVEVVFPAGAGARTVRSLESSEDAVSWRPVAFRASTEGGAAVLAVEPLAARALRVGGSAPIEAVRIFSPGETVAVRVTGFAAEAGEYEATIRYRTSIPVPSEVVCGFDPRDMRSPGSHSAERSTDHAVHVPGLLPGTDYYVWVLPGNGEAVGRSPDRPFVFQTQGQPYPRVVATDVLERKADRLKIRLRSNVPTKIRLAWGERVDAVYRSDRIGTAHVFEVPDLAPRTEYVYHAVLEDAGGRKMTMPPASIRTAEANVALGAAVEGTFRLLTESMETGPALPRVTDGRLDYFEGMASSGDPAVSEQWVRVDLGRPRVLEEIEVVWRGNACPKSFFVVVGRDTAEMRYPGGPYDAEAGDPDRSERGDPLRHVRIDPGTDPVRFITVHVPAGSPIHVQAGGWTWVQLAEVKAHLRPGFDDRSTSAQQTRATGHGGVR